MKPGPRIFPAFLSGLRSRSISAAVPVVAPAGRECGIARLRRSVAATITLSTRSRSRFRAPDAYQARSERSREGVAYDHRGRRLPRRRVGAIARSRNPLGHGNCARRRDPRRRSVRQCLPAAALGGAALLALSRGGSFGNRGRCAVRHPELVRQGGRRRRWGVGRTRAYGRIRGAGSRGRACAAYACPRLRERPHAWCPDPRRDRVRSSARRPLAPPDRQSLPDRPEKLHLTRLRQDAAVRVEPAVRILLEDPLAALLVERVLLRLVAHDDGMLAERIAADDAARRGVAGLGGHGGSSSMSGGCARTSCPLSAKIRRTRPLAVERISLN